MNLFVYFDELLNPEVVSQIALYVDEPVDKTKKAVQTLIYTVVGGLIKRVTSDIGVNQLANQIQRGRYQGQLIAKLPTLFKEPSHVNAMVTAGNDAISHLLPALKSSIASMVTAYSAMRNSSAISLLGLTTSLVLDKLGREMHDQKLDADGIAASLFEQRDAFLQVVPDDLMPQLIEKLGLQALVTPTASSAKRPPTPAVAARSTVTTSPVSFANQLEDDSSGDLLKWGLGALVVVGLAIGGFFLWQNAQQKPTVTQADDTSLALPTDSITADTVARSLAVPKDTVTLPAAPVAVTPPVAATSAGATSALTAQLTAYLSNTAVPKGRLFSLPSVAFEPGTVLLTPGSESTITELINVLKANPTTQIRLIGYANDASGGGFTNKTLSFKRVNVIKQQLVSAGINYVRVDAVGVGTGVTPPKPGDSTAVRKPPMRKIDMRVVIK